MGWAFSRAMMTSYVNSHCLQGLEEESLAANCLDGALSAQLSKTLMPQAYLSPDRMTAFSRLSRFGITFAALTDIDGEAMLTSYLEAFRVRTSALPDEDLALTESAADCGQKWRESLAKFDHATSSWKTAQPSLFVDLDESLATWPRSGMTVDGQCWELPTLALRTSATDSGLWPTPTVKGNYNRKGASKHSGDGLATKVRNFATPTARDWKSGKASQATMDRNSRPLSEQIGGSLNPTWVEWLMGWPLGWTDLQPLETDKFQQWPQEHGVF